MISSAVIVPEPEDLSPTSPTNKRRQSSDFYNVSFKRQRTDTHPSRDSNNTEFSPSATSPLRRKPSLPSKGAAEERKRGQRLFGALLGTLSQSSTTTAQRRRADIEKKQLGKLQQRDEELEEEKRKKREELDVIRRNERKVWDEQSMRIRHRNMLAEAHFLTTKAEPKLFYKPWELRPEEEEQIKRQIEDTEKAIQIEIDEHQVKQRNNDEGGKAEEPETPKNAAEDDGQPKAEMVGADTTADEQITTDKSIPELDTTNDEDKIKVTANLRQEETKRQEEKTSEDHGGEELVEGQEDDVMY